MMIGTPLSARIAAHTSSPSMPGSIRSSSTRSGAELRNASTAALPSLQKWGSNSADRSTMPIISASAGSSSTTRMRGVMVSVFGWAAREAARPPRLVQEAPRRLAWSARRVGTWRHP
jgi:hypothetical protein